MVLTVTSNCLLTESLDSRAAELRSSFPVGTGRQGGWGLWLPLSEIEGASEGK